MPLKPARLQWSEDGSVRSLDFGDIYFQPGKGKNESHYVFLEKNNIPGRFAAPDLRFFALAETGFGTGLNFLLTLSAFTAHAPKEARLTYVSFEKHPLAKPDLEKILKLWPEFEENAQKLLSQYPPLIEGFHTLFFLEGRVQLLLVFGDVRDTLPEMTGKMDAWYLDGFAPAKNPEMWEENLFLLIAACTKPGGTLSTFSAAGAVRRTLAHAGFQVSKADGFGTKRDMTVAIFPGNKPPTKQRQEIIVLGAGIAGASAAYAFARRGISVTVIDQHPGAGMETSGNPVGILYPKITAAPSPAGTFYQHGFLYTRRLLENLFLPSWNSCGVLHLDIDAEKTLRHQKIAALGLPPDYVDHLETEWGWGLWQPMAGYLSPPEFCRRLLQHPSIHLGFNEKIAPDFKGEGITVYALGTATNIFPETASLPLQPLRGQISYAAATETSKKLHHVICHDGYIAPAIDGTHYFGATFQKENPDIPSLRAEDHAQNLEKLNRYLPTLGLSHVTGGRAGYRATTPDKLPMIGQVPNHLQKYVLTGLGAHGLAAAPIGGEIIAAVAMEEPLPIPTSLLPYLLPERFIRRDLKRKNIHNNN